jgi:antitoxin CcdA
MGSQTRKPANLSLDDALVQEARALNINLSRAAEAGLRRAVAEARAAEWLAENAAALESSNRFVLEHGLPLGRYRPF